MDDGDDDDAMLKHQVSKLSDTLRGWVNHLPSKQRIKETLGKFVQQMDEPDDPIEQFAPRGLVGAGPQQSFYKTFNEVQKKAKSNGANTPGTRKGKGKGKQGTEDLPKFDLRRAFPECDVLAWQRLSSFLERGDALKIRQKTVCLCQSVGQILEFQEMAKAWGKEYLLAGGTPLSIILVAAVKNDDPNLCHAKEALLPFIGNIAMMKAVLVELSGQEVQFEQADPKKISMKSIPVRDIATLRVHIALDYVERKHRDNILHQPAYALSLVGVEDHFKEAKTFQWTSAFRMVSGYVQVPSDKLKPTLSRSGHGGIFFQKLARDSSSHTQDVEWHQWKEGQSYFEYHQSAIERAASLGSFLTIRKGGGSNLGIVTDKLLHRDRHWALYGVQYHSGPNSVSTLLKDLGWDVVYRPTEPNGVNRPWLFFGKPKEGDMQSNYTYVIPAEDDRHSEQYIRICTHSRQRKMQDEEIEHLGNKKKWWDAEVAATLRFEPEIAPTLPDVTQDDAMQGEEKISPAKKKMRKIMDLDITKRSGPGGFQLVDLGGCGDCAYRCVAFGLAFLNAKGFAKDPSEEAKVMSKVKELGQVLRVQAVTHLLNKDTAWQLAWAPDESATECTEAGTIPANLEQFKLVLKREQRWACGLTLQVISNIKKVNLIVFEDKADQWIRTGLITCEDGTTTKSRKSLALVLHGGHYFLVKTLNVDQSWLSTSDVVWCSKTKRPRGFFSRGGVADFAGAIADGPEGLQLVNLGGHGDCAYRCVAFGLEFLAAWGFPNDSAAEEAAKLKAIEFGQALRQQAVEHLLHGDTTWQDFWAPDESATICSEAGSIPTCLEQFKETLQRKQRWACGLTLQAIANIRAVNLIVFEDKGDRWVRTGLIKCLDEATSISKTLVLALFEGHYFFVKTLDIGSFWLANDRVVCCGKAQGHRDHISRGGVASSKSPGKFSTTSLEKFCKPCSTIPSPGKTSPKAVKGFGSEMAFLRACSSKRSPGTAKGSVAKTFGYQPIKKDKGVLEKTRTWTCKICGFQLHGGSYNEIRGKIDYHLHRVHEARYRELVSDTQKLGMKLPGLSIKNLVQPV